MTPITSKDWTQQQLSTANTLADLIDSLSSSQAFLAVVQYYREADPAINGSPRAQLLQDLERAVNKQETDPEILARLSGCVYFAARCK